MAQPNNDSATTAATAEVFLRAFKALPRGARSLVIEQLAQDGDVFEDMEAAFLWEQRKDEPRQSFDEYLAEYEARQE
ncbi:MAG: hypothetical protein ABIK09_10140 [Pseudomonadota bacterium]